MFLFVSIGFLASIAYIRIKAAFEKKGTGDQKGEELKHVTARARDRLKCGCGKSMNLVGECGHLSMCTECH
jgi:hypothetical protein